jgi:hypothetical protein
VPGEHDADNSANWIIRARSRLALRGAGIPATKAGQIRTLWPDIEAALAVGHTVKSICRWLEEDAGITLGVTSLTSYISRIRRREIRTGRSQATVEPIVQPIVEQTSALPSARPSGAIGAVPKQPARNLEDPLAPAMRVLSKPKLDIRKMHNDGDPEGRNLI